MFRGLLSVLTVRKNARGHEVQQILSILFIFPYYYYTDHLISTSKQVERIWKENIPLIEFDVGIITTSIPWEPGLSF